MKEIIILVNRASKYHRNESMSFYEDKTANILKKFGHDIYVISTSLKNKQKEHETFDEGGIKYIYLKNCNPEKLSVSFAYELKKYLINLIKHFKVKSIFGNSLDLYPLCTYNEFKQIKFFHNIHSPLSTVLEKNVFFYKKIYNFYKYIRRIIKTHLLIYKILNNKNNKLIFSSINLKNLFENEVFVLKFLIKSNSYTIPLCLNIDNNFSNEKNLLIKKKLHKINQTLYSPIISFIGRINSKKGIETIIESAIILKKQNIIPFFFIGGLCSYNYEKKLEKMLNINGLDNVILVTDGINNKETPYYYYNSDIAVHISNIFEGMSYSILEAMLNECVVITNYSNEIISDNAIFVKKSTSENLSKIIIQLINNKNMINSIKLKAKKTVENNYSDKVFYNFFSKIY
jgi:glycosyltransferase involved in cell wall biosynthesis